MLQSSSSLEGFVLSLGPFARLAQDEESGSTSSEGRGRGALGPTLTLPCPRLLLLASKKRRAAELCSGLVADKTGRTAERQSAALFCQFAGNAQKSHWVWFKVGY